MADNTPTSNAAAAISHISTLTGVRESSIAAVSEYEILPSQVTSKLLFLGSSSLPLL